MHVCLDSRLIKPGDYFIPVIGETSDGHTYIEQALKNGAAGIIEESELYGLAHQKLQQLHPKIIAITGSVGKTSTKNYIKTLLDTKFKTCDGYLNTKLGLATNIINDMTDDCEVFVAECGMDKAGELTATGNFLKPDIVVLTNVSESHMEKLGSLENIKEAKAELIKTLKPGGTAFFNFSNPNVIDVFNKYAPENSIKYGIEFNEESFVGANVIGAHNYINLDGACKIAKFMGLTQEEISAGLKQIKASKGRLNKITGINNCIIFDDTYNASPYSTTYSLKAVSDYYSSQKLSGRKIAILGGMLELGSFETQGHIQVGDSVAENAFDVLILIGELAKKINQSKKLPQSKIQIFHFETADTAAEFIKNKLQPTQSDVILVKASQGIRLEKLVKLIMQNPDQAKDLLVRQDVRWE